MKTLILAAVAAATLGSVAPAATAQPYGYYHHGYGHRFYGHRFGYGPRFYPRFGGRRFCYYHPGRCGY